MRLLLHGHVLVERGLLGMLSQVMLSCGHSLKKRRLKREVALCVGPVLKPRAFPRQGVIFRGGFVDAMVMRGGGVWLAFS